MLLTSTISLFCLRVLASGNSLSKMALLQANDLLFNPEKKSAEFSCSFDPSLYQLHAANNFLTQETFNSLVIPLWNPLNGCGHSLIGDPQSFLFSPFRLLFPVSNFQLYNFSIILELFIGAFFVYLLAKELRFKPMAALFASLSFSFCPYYLWYFELPNHFELYPVAFYLLARLRNKSNLKQAMLTGLGLSFLIYSMHPECAFYSIGMAAQLFISLTLVDFFKQKESGLKNLASAVSPLAIAAFTTLMVSAPLLLPFLEFLLNSTSYKQDTISMGSLPLSWYMLLSNLFYPANGHESPYIGSVACALILVSIFFITRKTIAISIVAFLSFLLTTYPGPIATLIQTSPFNVLVPIYCLPCLLLCLCLLSAHGFTRVVDKDEAVKLNHPIVLCTLLVALLPLLISYIPALQKAQYAAPLSTWFQNNGALRQESLIPLAILALAVLSLSRRLKLYPLGFGLLITLLNLSSMYSQASIALGPHKTISWSTPEIVKELKKNTGRSLACGIHTYLPNSNMVFQTTDFRLYNPFFPNRYLDYMLEAGAKKFDLYHYGFANTPSKLLDIASVKYMISPEPMIESDAFNLKNFSQSPIKLDCKEIEVIDCKQKYSNLEQALFVVSKFKIAQYSNKRITAQAKLLSQDKEVIYQSRKQLVLSPGANKLSVLKFCLPVPLHLESKSSITPYLVIQVAEEEPVSTALAPFILENENRNGSIENEDFRLLKEDRAGIRLYENKNALPDCYLVENCIVSNSSKNSLAHLTESEFDPKKMVILETQNGMPIKSKPERSSKNNVDNQSFYSLKLMRPNPNQIDIDLDTKRSAYLVLTDTYFPGWRASIDGEYTEIYRANYLFRALFVEAGKHKISFKYSPESFWIGLVLAGSFLGAGFILLTYLENRKRSQRPKRKGALTDKEQ